MNKNKKIWVIRMLSGNPFQEESQERSVMLAASLAEKGYKVTYWGTTYHHSLKKHMWDETIHKTINANEDAVMIHAKTTYSRNLSFKRYVYGWELAKRLSGEMENGDKHPKPDIIFVAYPQEEICTVVEKFAKENKIPVIVDARDQWPDIFDKAIPGYIRWMSPLLLAPLKKRAKRVFRSADAICSTSPIALRWALNYAGREKSTLDRCVYLGKRKIILDEEVLKTNLKYLEQEGISADTWNLCLFSSLSKRILDTDTLVEAVRQVHNTYPSIRLVIGGRGDEEERLKKISEESPYIKLLGYMNEEQMTSLMSISKAGLIPYKNQSDLKNAWGNKIGQYLSYGLPLLNSTEGIAKDYIDKYKCGFTYKEGNTAELASIIKDMMDNADIQKELSQNALRRYSEDFQESDVMQKLEDMINETYAAHQKRNKV